jgi:stringent starvation protein B
METTPPKPYILRALHEWCTDNGLTPHVAVAVDENVRIPPEYVRDGQITLNIAHEATGGLILGNDALSFKARFNGVPRDIYIPVANVAAIYASENGIGMRFEPEKASPPDDAPEPRDPKPQRPHLQRVK